jgi:hypothetical protein
MVSLVSLWAPILLAAVLVFVVSSIIHMFLPYHRSDYKELPDEDGVMDALRTFDIAPGDYMVPATRGPEHMRSDEYKAKVEKGPVVVMTVWPRGAVFNMGPQLTKWFVYNVMVSVVAAYVGTFTLNTGAEYMDVFRLTGTVAFASYAMALPMASIWFNHNWPSTLKSMFDGLVYGLVTAGAFGWLWPA